MNQKLWKIHNWLGLYTGLVIGLLCFTGVLAVFIPEVDRWINIRHFQINESETDSYRFGNREMEGVLEAYPGFNVSMIELPERKSDPMRIALINAGNEKVDRQLIYVYVNPDTGEVLGARDHLNGLTNFLRQFHVRLFDNWFGRQLVGLAGIGLLLLTLTGLFIYGGFMRKQDYGDIRKNKRRRVFWADWHKLIGITALFFNFIIAVTGAWLGLQPQIMKWSDMKTPHFYTRNVIVDAEHDFSQNFDIGSILKQTAVEFASLKPAYLRLSDNGSSFITIEGNIEGTIYERHINRLILDKETLLPLFKYDIREQGLFDKLFFVQEALHFGDFAGLPLKVLYGLLGITGSFLSISGYYIYLKRSRTGKEVNRKPSVSQLIGWWLSITVLLTFIIAMFHILIGYTITSGVVTVSVYASIAFGLLYGLRKLILSKGLMVRALK